MKLSSILVWTVLALLPLTGDSVQAQQVPRLQEVAAWGCTSCTGPELLGRPEAVRVTRSGSVVLVDHIEPMLRIFSQGEDPVGTVREGNGPGELVLPLGIFLERHREGGQVFTVLDMGQFRLSRFDRAGRFIESLPMGGSRSRLPERMAQAVDGAAFISFQDFTRWTSVIAGWSGREDFPPLFEVTPFPEETDPVTFFFDLAAGPDSLLAVGNGKTSYDIRLFRSDGAPAGRLHREIPRTPKREEEIESERERRLRAAARMGRENPEGGSGGVEIDPFHPHFKELRFDGAGRLWVLTYRGGGRESVFDLFGREGTYLGEVRAGAPGRLFDIGGDWLVLLGPDRDEIPRLTLFRILPGG